MSRLRRAAHSVASGYVVLGVTAVCSLVSLPIALHYLTIERFGLWTLMSTIGVYLSLVDLGMSGAMPRLFIDHKDNPQHGSYGSFFKTGWLVLIVQGLLVFAAGWVLAPLLSKILDIQSDLENEFIHLLRWQSTALALNFVLRIFSHLLQAHQRIDIINYSQIAMLCLNLMLQWLFFRAGQGVFSLAWSTLLSASVTALLCFAACSRLHLFPPRDASGHASWHLFKEIFSYGKDMFLVSVGTNLIMTSQAIIITRQLGLAKSGIWYTATRTFNLISQAVWRLSDVSGPAFSEMLVRNERALLKERYKSVLIMTASMSAFAAVGFALCNSLFVQVYTLWSGHPVDWPASNDVLLGIWLILTSILHVHNCFVLITKRIGFMRYVYFLEGIIFVSAAMLTARWGGLPAIITCSIVCSICFSGAYGTWRVSRHFELPVSEVTLRWLTPMARVLLFLIPTAVLVWRFSLSFEVPILRLAFDVLIICPVGFYILLRFGLSLSFQRELLLRAPRSVNPLLKWIFVEMGH